MTKNVKTTAYSFEQLFIRSYLQGYETKEDITIEAQEHSPKEEHILRSALTLLAEVGDAGMTMRRLAEHSGMRLSNVQYYYPSRNHVLKAMVGLYFEDCIDAVTTLAADQTHTTMRARLRYVIREGLKHGETVSPLCRTFRELWAISSRNPEIQDCLVAYYQSFGSKLIGFAVGDAVCRPEKNKLITLIVPYLEGYSITGSALPCDADTTTDFLTDLAMSIIGKEGV